MILVIQGLVEVMRAPIRREARGDQGVRLQARGVDLCTVRVWGVVKQARQEATGEALGVQNSGVRGET